MIITEINGFESVERPMTSEELAQHEADQAAATAKEAAEILKAQEKQALLNRLGITADEAKLLLS